MATPRNLVHEKNYVSIGFSVIQFYKVSLLELCENKFLQTSTIEDELKIIEC